MRQQLVRQWNTYQLVAVIIDRLKDTHKLSSRAQQLLTYLERSRSGTGLYLILCQLNTMIFSLDLRANKSSGANWLCIDHSQFVDRIMSSIMRFAAPRVKAAYNAAVLSVSVRQLLRRSVRDLATLHRT